MTKVDIFSGFLGAGKTSLIRKLIEEAYEDEKIVLIENEFGEIGVDSSFLKNTGIQINEMNAGCICCTLVGDFGRALSEVIEQYNPDRILIEPSGVGKLSDVILAVQNLHNEHIELNSFTTVIDAKRFKPMMRSFGEFYKNQVENASTIVLSHQSDMPKEKLDEVIEAIKELNEGAAIVTTTWENLDGKKILNVMESSRTISAEIEKLKDEACGHDHHHDHECECGCGHEHHDHEHHHHDHECECGCGHDHHDHEHHHHDHEHHHHDHECECGCGHDHHDHDHHHDHECTCGCHGHHDHDHHHADEVFDELATRTSNKYTKEEIESILGSFDDCGQVLRAKGIVETPDGKWLEFDYVPGEGEVRDGQTDATGTVIVIGTNLNKDKLKELFRF